MLRLKLLYQRDEQVLNRAFADRALRGARAAGSQIPLDYVRETIDLEKQVQHWNDLSLAAKTFQDVVKLGEKIDPELDKFIIETRKARSRLLSETASHPELFAGLK